MLYPYCNPQTNNNTTTNIRGGTGIVVSSNQVSGSFQSFKNAHRNFTNNVNFRKPEPQTSMGHQIPVQNQNRDNLQR